MSALASTRTFTRTFTRTARWAGAFALCAAAPLTEITPLPSSARIA